MQSEIKENNKDGVENKIFLLQSLYPEAARNLIDYLMTMKVAADPNNMYIHQAMHFIKAMWKEWSNQINNGNFSLMKKLDVPKEATTLPVVWQMKRKRDKKPKQ